MSAYVVLNGAGYRWGSETYPTADAAIHEVRAFFRGISGVRFDRFSIVPLGKAPEVDTQYIIPGAMTAAQGVGSFARPEC